MSILDVTPEAAKNRFLLAGVGAASTHLGVMLAAGLLSTRPSRSDVLQPPTAVTQMVEIAAAAPPAVEPAQKKALAAMPRAAARPALGAAVSEALTTELPSAKDTIISGSAERFAGGISETGGTASEAVRDAAGVSGGTMLSHARAAMLAGGNAWDCPFPEDADIDSAAVTLRVNVGKDGRVSRVSVVEDPQSGFGREAKRCAMSKQWQPALDDAGVAIASETLIKVRFDR